MIRWEQGGKTMELRVLKYFLAVAREENITKAVFFSHIVSFEVFYVHLFTDD